MEETIKTQLRSRLSTVLYRSAFWLATDINQNKMDVNRCLYSLKEEGVAIMLEGTPPLWRLKEQPIDETKEIPPLPVVIVDLGNVHDVLQKLEPYSKQGLAYVYAFADLAFNGFGINPKPDESITVFQAKTADRNAADLHMIHEIIKICITNKYPGSTIFIVTRDQGFRTLSTIAEQYGYKIIFVTGWEGALRDAVE